VFGAPKLLHFGTKVNSVFTLARRSRYAFAMLVLAAAILAAPPPAAPSARASASAQAIATVRIISGAVLRLGEGPRSGIAPMAQDTVVHADGALRPARLIEFE
jgi:hypothetical protein